MIFNNKLISCNQHALLEGESENDDAPNWGSSLNLFATGAPNGNHQHDADDKSEEEADKAERW